MGKGLDPDLWKSGWANSPELNARARRLPGFRIFDSINSLAVWESNYARAICFGLLELDGLGA